MRYKVDVVIQQDTRHKVQGNPSKAEAAKMIGVKHYGKC